MKPERLRLLLALGLIGTLALAWFAPRDEDTAGPAERAKHGRKAAAERSKTVSTVAAPTAVAMSARSQLASAGRPALADDIPDLFKSFSWYVPPPPPPPPPPAPPPPPPKPAPPPLPFAFMGQYADGNTRVFILSRGDRVMTVAIGGVIDNTYKVDSISGSQLVFVYLPLDMKQTLNTGVIP